MEMIHVEKEIVLVEGCLVKQPSTILTHQEKILLQFLFFYVKTICEAIWVSFLYDLLFFIPY